MIRIYELDKMTLFEAYYLNYFYGYDITVKNGKINVLI